MNDQTNGNEFIIQNQIYSKPQEVITIKNDNPYILVDDESPYYITHEKIYFIYYY